MRKGDTSKWLLVSAFDPTTGVALDDLVAADFPSVKIRNGSTAVAIAALTDVAIDPSGNDNAWVEGGVFNVGDGEYLLGMPNASWALAERTDVWGKSSTVELSVEAIDVQAGTAGVDDSSASDLGNLTSLARVKRIPSMAAITDDDYINDILKSVSQLVRNWCRRDFLLHTDEEELQDGDGSRLLITNIFPIVSVSSLIIINYDASESEIDLDDVVLSLPKGFIEFHGRSTVSDWSFFPKGKKNIQLTYTAGFATVPDPVQQGTAIWTAETCLSLKRDPSLAGETISKYTWKALAGSNAENAEPPLAARKYLSSYRSLGRPYSLQETGR